MKAVLILERMSNAREPFWRGGDQRGGDRLVLTVRTSDECGGNLIACGIDPDAALRQAVVFDANLPEHLLHELVALIMGGDGFVGEEVPDAPRREIRFRRRTASPTAAASGPETPRSPSQGEGAPHEPTPPPAANEAPEGDIVVLPDPGPTGGNGPKMGMVALVRMLVAINEVAGNIEDEGSDLPEPGDDAASALQ